MVGTRLALACLAVCVLTADATQISAAVSPPRAITSIQGNGDIPDFPIASRKSGMSPFPAAQVRAAKSVPFGTDIGLKCLVAAMLVAYQLRRKHRALRAQPFSF